MFTKKPETKDIFVVDAVCIGLRSLFNVWPVVAGYEFVSWMQLKGFGERQN